MNKKEEVSQPLIYNFKTFLFFLGLTLLVFFSVILIDCPSDPQYNIFRLTISISLAGIGAYLPGFLKVEYRKMISAGGALALFVIIYFFEPAKGITTSGCLPYDITVQFRTEDPSDSERLVSETVSLYVGNRRIGTPKKINEYGEVTFNDIPSQYAGDSLKIESSNNLIRVSQKNIRLIDLVNGDKLFAVAILPDSTTVQGSVSVNGNVAGKADVYFDNFTIQTDINGRYKFRIPFAEGTLVRTEVHYNDKIYCEDYKRVTEKIRLTFECYD